MAETRRVRLPIQTLAFYGGSGTAARSVGAGVRPLSLTRQRNFKDWVAPGSNGVRTSNGAMGGRSVLAESVFRG